MTISIGYEVIMDVLFTSSMVCNIVVWLLDVYDSTFNSADSMFVVLLAGVWLTCADLLIDAASKNNAAGAPSVLFDNYLIDEVESCYHL